MWPFKQKTKHNTGSGGSDALRDGIARMVVDRLKSKLELERFLIIHDKMPVERKDDDAVDFAILGARAISCIMSQVCRIENFNLSDESEEHNLIKFAFMVSMADIISQRTGGQFELTVHLTHCCFISIFSDENKRMFKSVDHLDNDEYAALISRKACDLHKAFHATESGAKATSECALATWRWISELDIEALSTLCDRLGPRTQK